jgi:hypothetical protein
MPDFTEKLTLQVEGHGCLLYYQPRNTDTTPSIQIGSAFYSLVNNIVIFIVATYLHPLFLGKIIWIARN